MCVFVYATPWRLSTTKREVSDKANSLTCKYTVGAHSDRDKVALLICLCVNKGHHSLTRSVMQRLLPYICLLWQSTTEATETHQSHVKPWCHSDTHRAPSHLRDKSRTERAQITAAKGQIIDRLWKWVLWRFSILQVILKSLGVVCLGDEICISLKVFLYPLQ